VPFQNIDRSSDDDVAKQVAEKGRKASQKPENHPSGAKAHVYFQLCTARLKSCPVTKRLFETHFAGFSAGCKARVDFAVLTARGPEGAPVVPCYKTCFSRSL
jgi:hypothetical protein